MRELKTKVNGADVDAFLNTVPDDAQRAGSLVLLKISAKMWGSGIIGFGQYHYKSGRSGHEGGLMLTGFSASKAHQTLYIMPGFDVCAELLAKLGKREISVGCLYIHKLTDVCRTVLRQLVMHSYQDMKTRHG